MGLPRSIPSSRYVNQISSAMSPAVPGRVASLRLASMDRLLGSDRGGYCGDRLPANVTLVLLFHPYPPCFQFETARRLSSGDIRPRIGFVSGHLGSTLGMCAAHRL